MPSKQTISRITVDERLHNSLFRLLISHPGPGAETIALGDACLWQDEDAAYATPGNLLRLLGVGGEPGSLGQAVEQVTGVPTGKPTAAQAWNGLAEGMVFLSGAFETIADKAGGEPVAIKPLDKGRDRFLRIDGLAAVKSGIRAAYAAAVSGQDRGQNHA
jgi:hypothetical protein